MAGLSDVAAAMLNSVPAAVGMLAMVYVGRRATRLDERRWHSAARALAIGFGLALRGIITGLPGLLFLALVAAVGGAFQPPLLASMSSAAIGPANAVGTAFVNSVAAVGGFVGPCLLGLVVDPQGGFAAARAVAGTLMAIVALGDPLVRHKPSRLITADAV